MLKTRVCRTTLSSRQLALNKLRVEEESWRAEMEGETGWRVGKDGG